MRAALVRRALESKPRLKQMAYGRDRKLEMELNRRLKMRYVGVRKKNEGVDRKEEDLMERRDGGWKGSGWALCILFICILNK